MKNEKTPVPDAYLKQKYVWEGILNRRLPKRTLIKAGVGITVIPVLAIADSAAQKFKVGPQNTIPIQSVRQIGDKILDGVNATAGKITKFKVPF